MAHEVETMFYTRERPWHGLGVRVTEAPNSENALRLAGLDWDIIQHPIYADGQKVEGYQANVRNTDGKVLGVVTNRYQVIQNKEAFAFTDALLGEGVKYETAGSLLGGRRVWLLARMPREYIIGGERISPFLVFTNTHDGSGAVRVAVTPIRVVCSNTLNLALSQAKRSWSMIHTGNVNEKLNDARNTLFLAEEYMDGIGEAISSLQEKALGENLVNKFIELLLPVEDGATSQQRKNVLRLRDDLAKRYYDAPDLRNLGNTAYRFINAVSDHATHSEPLRRTPQYRENLFIRTMDGHPMIDKAYQLVRAA
ncbi:MAG: DUF932 domain-containing protein [Lachnospiraceae bacterium]|nr:DUF932 domain-containing protein [Lachnospiraceae bacterium]